jgi:hypothetical protein
MPFTKPSKQRTFFLAVLSLICFVGDAVILTQLSAIAGSRSVFACVTERTPDGNGHDLPFARKEVRLHVSALEMPQPLLPSSHQMVIGLSFVAPPRVDLMLGFTGLREPPLADSLSHVPIPLLC